jgi:hypothetical protein
MSHLSILKDRNPLHALNSNNQTLHKQVATYTDLRI